MSILQKMGWERRNSWLCAEAENDVQVAGIELELFGCETEL